MRSGRHAQSASSVLGCTEPRIWTPPLRELTPETSYGFDVNMFARDVLFHPLDPWQEWLTIHAGELLPDGRPRFRIVVVLVARQNGKTEVPVVLSTYWQFVEAVPLILGTSTKLDYARESWIKACKLIEGTEELAPLRGKKWKREANGEQESWTLEGSRYKIAASNEEGGRSLTIHKLICDELRQHRTYAAWDAAEPATNAVWDAQIWCLSNAGDTRSVVLNDLQDDARTFIETGEGDDRLGLFEWSAPKESDPTDPYALAQANPNMNRRIDGSALVSSGRRAKAKGGEALTGFKTEKMCIRVKILNPALDPGAWTRCGQPGDLSRARSRVAACVDVSPDQLHATLYAAAVVGSDKVRIDFVRDWSGQGCAAQVRRDLPGEIRKMKPQIVGWLPTGPAAAIAADMKENKGRDWPPPGVTVTEVKSEMAAVCLGFDKEVSAETLLHSNDPLLNAQVGGTERLPRGDAWVFSRKGDGHCDAVYAAAGAVHLARTLPPPIGALRLIVAE